MKKELFFVILWMGLYVAAFAQQQEEQMDTTAMKQETMEGTSFDTDVLDDEGTGNNTYVPSMLHSSRDAFTNNSGYNFGIAYFRTRGLDSKYQSIAINGIEMENAVSGRAPYSQWGGLNHIFKWPESVNDLYPVTFVFGDMGGSTNYNIRASNLRRQVRASYSLSNRSYNNRFMLTYASGMLPKGWSVAASASVRFGNQLNYVKGTDYKGIGYFVAVEKQFNREHALNLAIWGAPTERAMQSNSTQEVYELTGDHYYNSNWGWYNGEKRNARIRRTFEPVFMLSHFYTPENNKLQINTNVVASFGRQSTSALNWGNVPDPRPDYYRNLPSYYIEEDQAFLREYYTYMWKNVEDFGQIDWNKMYEVNQLAAKQGKQAQYILENRNIDHVHVAGATNIVANINDHLKLMGGVDIRGYYQRNYKTINDLLGGSYWLNEDKYADGASPDNPDLLYDDLENKGAKLGVGDKFGYDYAFNIYKAQLWATAKFNFSHIDFHVGLSETTSLMWRTGYMRNGRFPEASKGNSAMKVFYDYGLKAGITYKINGRNYLVLNAMVKSEAPSVMDVFLSPTIHNKYVDHLKSETDIAADLSYVMRYPFMRMRVSLFYAKFMNVTDLFSFYHDEYGCFVNYAMSNIDKQNIGAELGIEIPIGSMFTIVAAGSYGDYIYTNRPNVTITADNGYDLLGNGTSEATEKVYWKNYHVSGGPQVAATLGLKFNYKYWWVSVNANYFDKIYADLNPQRLTTAARGTLATNDPVYQALVKQEKMKGQFTLDASIGKSWKIKSRHTLGFNLSVTNITNNKNLVTSAWQQRRYDYTTYRSDKFPPKYYYALGTTFYLGINYTFN